MKRNLAIILLLAVFLVIYLSFTHTRNITNFPSVNSGIVAFGDSLVEGIGSSKGGGFVKMLSADLNLPIRNLGKSGDTTADALERVSEVTNLKPALVILLFGGNDFLRGVKSDTTQRNLKEIIDAIHLSGSAVLLVGLEADTVGVNHSALFEKLAGELKTGYVPDILEGIYGNPQLMSDNLHPNDEGYRIMAGRIKPELVNLARK
jgi:acyl-CoA thioesterase I